MAPFRWPEMKHELVFAKEVAKYFPEKPQEWDEVAKILSKAFSKWSVLKVPKISPLIYCKCDLC